MKKQLAVFAATSILLTTSLYGCSNDANNNKEVKKPGSIEKTSDAGLQTSNTSAPSIAPRASEIGTQASAPPLEIVIPQVEKIEKVSDFTGVGWVSNGEIMGYGKPLSPNPNAHSLTYPDRPVQFYNISGKSKKSVDGLVMYRFDYMSSKLSPDKKHDILFSSKCHNNSIFDIETKKIIPIQGIKSFIEYEWLNNKEIIFTDFLAQNKTIYKCNVDGTQSKIADIDRDFELLFAVGDRIYLCKHPDSNEKVYKKEFYYSDTSLSNYNKLAEFSGDVELVGSEIILKESKDSDKVNSDAKSDDLIPNYSIEWLDKDFKKKVTLFDTNNNKDISIVGINEDNVLYTITDNNQVMLYEMNINSKKKVEIFNSGKGIFKRDGGYDIISVGISGNKKKIFVNLLYYDDSKKDDVYDVALISLK